MRIGIMLRHMDQHGGGVMVYTKELLPLLFQVGGGHTFVLFYSADKHIGTYSQYGNVEEYSLNVSSRLIWDQVAVTYAARKQAIDILFNLKYSLPLFSGRPAVFVCHGLDWYVMPWGVNRIDRLNHKLLVPRYARRAAGIIAVSESTRDQAIHYWNLRPQNVVTVHHGVSDEFRRVIQQDELDEVRVKYGLPEKFLLYVGQIYPPKNFPGIVRAFAQTALDRGVKLVVAGGHIERSPEQDLALIAELGIEDSVVWTGWLEKRDLNCIYAMAEALLMPSLYDSFLMPLVEAMMVGCPVITANRHGTKDVVGDAGILVDPTNVDEISTAIQRILTDSSLRERLVHSGYVRARRYSWIKCATETIRFLEQTYEKACS